VFCDLSGSGRRSEVLVKDRYHRIWAYTNKGKLLWTVKDPGGYRTAHQPRPMDLDGDGRDEIMAGYAMLNPDGSVRWIYHSKTVKQEVGHLDCVRVLREGKTPGDFRLALTCLMIMSLPPGTVRMVRSTMSPPIINFTGYVPDSVPTFATSTETLTDSPTLTDSGSITRLLNSKIASIRGLFFKTFLSNYYSPNL